MTYKGKGTFVERDKTNHKVVVDAQGRDSRGNGTASAKATLTMTDDGGKTKVNVLTEMQVTGKPAQFGRGVMADVGDKILGQFASCLADEFSSSTSGGPAAATVTGTDTGSTGGDGTRPAPGTGPGPPGGNRPGPRAGAGGRGGPRAGPRPPPPPPVPPGWGGARRGRDADHGGRGRQGGLGRQARCLGRRVRERLRAGRGA